ncbi:hypothetical protein ACSSS7_002813 [Eimeria intestinalis]
MRGMHKNELDRRDITGVTTGPLLAYIRMHYREAGSLPSVGKRGYIAAGAPRDCMDQSAACGTLFFNGAAVAAATAAAAAAALFFQTYQKLLVLSGLVCDGVALLLHGLVVLRCGGRAKEASSQGVAGEIDDHEAKQLVVRCRL